MASAVDIKIGADTSKARREIKQLGGVFAKLDRQSKRAGAAMSSPFMAVAAGAAAAGTAVAALSAALVKNAMAVAAMGDEFAKTSRVLGVTNEETQQLSFLAGRARVDFSKLNAGLKRLQRNMLDSVTGNKRMAETFQRLGITVQGADGRLRNVMDVSRDLADRIKEMGQGADATGTLMLLLGRAGTETADIFLQGSEAFDRADASLRRLGGYMTDEAIASSEAYQAAVADLNTSLIGLKSSLAEELLPVMTAFVETMANTVVPTITEFAVPAVKELASEFANLIPKPVLIAMALLGVQTRKMVEEPLETLRKVQEETAILEALMAGEMVGAKPSAPRAAPSAPARPAPTSRRAAKDTGIVFAPVSLEEIEITKDGIEVFRNYREEQRRAYIESANARQVSSEAHERRMQQLRDELALQQQVAEIQIETAGQVFGHISEFAAMAQQAVEDSYFGQTRAGKTAAKVMFAVSKAAAIAQAAVNTAVAVTNALKVEPYPVGAALAVSAGIAGGAQIATIAATAIQGIADAGLAPGALREAGLNRHTVLAVRQDEMVMDPNGTSEITKMLSLQRRQMEMGVLGSANQPTEVIVEMDGRRLTRALGPHMTRSIEDGVDFRRNVRYAGAV